MKNETGIFKNAADEHIKTVKEMFKIDLDYSEKSINKLDEIIKKG